MTPPLHFKIFASRCGSFYLQLGADKASFDKAKLISNLISGCRRKVSKLKSKSRIHTDPFDFPQFHYLPPFPAPTTIFQTSIRVETHSKNGFYSAVSKAVPIPRRAGKRFELGGILKPQRTEYTPTGTRKCPAATSAIPRRSPPLKTSAAKTNRARFPAARNRKSPKKLLTNSRRNGKLITSKLVTIVQ